MNLRDLRYACAVAELEHFGRAAEACNVSQPTLSAQIRKLEAFLGVALFERTNKSVKVTPTGERIVAVARDILVRADEIRAIADARKDPLSGPLRLGLIPTIAPYLIPHFLQPLRARLGAVKPVFVEAVTATLLERLDAGDLDAAIIATDPARPRLREIPLYREPFWAALPRGHALGDQETIALERLDPGELLLLTEGHCLREQALAVCGQGAQAPTADTSATSLETLVNLVAAGHGVTLVPALALRGAWMTDFGVIARPCGGEAAARTVRLAHRAGFPRMALLQALARALRSSLPNTVAPLD